MRIQLRQKSLEKLFKSNSERKRKDPKAEAKCKYISKLMLYNKQMLDSSRISYDKSNDLLTNANLLKCNTEWPICLYDHTYKNKCKSYFSMRIQKCPEIIDAYFESLTFSSSKEKPEIQAEIISVQFEKTESYDSLSPIKEKKCEGTPKLTLNVTEDKRDDIAKKMNFYNSILIERNLHYCENEEFVAKMISLLEQNKGDTILWAIYQKKM